MGSQSTLQATKTTMSTESVALIPTSQVTGPTPSQEEPYLARIWEADEHHIDFGIPVEIEYGWTAKTRELVSDYINAVQMEFLVGGSTQPNPMSYWSEITEIDDLDGDGQKDFRSYWFYPLQKSGWMLSAGTHWVRLTVTLSEPVSDGFDLDGDGSLDVYTGSNVWETVLIIE